MSLTKGSGPFGEQPAGVFNFDRHPPEHVPYVEDVSRRVRVLLGDAVVADSDEVRLVHPPGRTPTNLFPAAHVRTDCFEPSERRQSDPGMGERHYWRVRARSEVAEDAAYSWQQPPQSTAAIAGGSRLRLGLVHGLRGGRGGLRTELLEPGDNTTSCP